MSTPPSPSTGTQTPDTLRRQAAQLARAGRHDDAAAAYAHLLALQPTWADGWYNLGQSQWGARQYEAALASYQRALDAGLLGPEEAHLNRAVILAQHLYRTDRAVMELDRALALNPNYVPALLNLGNLREQQGDRDGALALYQQVLTRDPGNGLALSRLPNLQALQGPDDPLIARLAHALGQTSRSPADLADLGFGLGKALDAVGRYDDAFAAFQAANQASRRAGGPGAHYDAGAHEAHVGRLIATFDRPSAASAVATDDVDVPIFICGMFRSGSTLVEQVLAAHPDLTAGGELDLLPNLARQHLSPGQPWTVLADAAALQRLAASYLGGLRQRSPAASRLTDKRPDNFLHIGLIKTLFPRARIVFTRRDALDNCLSLHFLHLSREMPYALDLLDTAHWYRQHLRLMAHWRALYGDDILEFSYDAFIDEPERQARRLLAFCGLAWDPACLQFHTTGQVVQTASLWQVREPIYRRASGRWRHYARHLGPLRAALGDAVSAPPADSPTSR